MLAVSTRCITAFRTVACFYESRPFVKVVRREEGRLPHSCNKFELSATTVSKFANPSSPYYSIESDLGHRRLLE